MNIIYGDYIVKNIISENPMRKLYITIKSNNLFMTEVLEREIFEKNNEEFKNYKESVSISCRTNHENILKCIDVKKTKKQFYITMEYSNGGTLDENLKKYKIKYGKFFSEKIIQYIIRKIIAAMSYLQSINVINLDLSFNNIYLNYHTEEAKNNIDIIHSNIKLKLSKTELIEDKMILGFFNYDPLIIKKYNEQKKIRENIRDKEHQISLYLFFNSIFNNNFIFREINEKEIKISINLSLEAISLLINLFQIYSKENNKKKNINELLKHPYLKNNFCDFSDFNKKIFAGFIKEEYLVININNIDEINSIINKQLNSEIK